MHRRLPFLVVIDTAFYIWPSVAVALYRACLLTNMERIVHDSEQFDT